MVSGKNADMVYRDSSRQRFAICKYSQTLLTKKKNVVQFKQRMLCNVHNVHFITKKG